MTNNLIKIGILCAFASSFVLGYRDSSCKAEEIPTPFDKRDRIPIGQRVLSPTQEAAVARLTSQMPGLRVYLDELLAKPNFVFSLNSFLTQPAVGPLEPNAPVKRFLDENADLFERGADILATARIHRESVMARNGLRTVIWQQYLDDIPIFEASLKTHITERGELVSVSHRLLSAPAAAAKISDEDRAALVAAPPIPAADALVRAAISIGESAEAGGVQALTERPEGPTQRQNFSASFVREEAIVELIWLPTDPSSVRLCWRVALTGMASGETFWIFADAQTGEVLLQRSLTVHASPASYRIFHSDSPTPWSPGDPTPSGAQPGYEGGATAPWYGRTLENLTALSLTASPNGWINDGETRTIGNNVDAHVDLTGTGNPAYNAVVNPPRPANPNRIFEYPMDFNLGPTTLNNQNAAVVHAFYWANWMHDKLYDLGFTETAGNFQQVNTFGGVNRGGVAGDPVLVDVQDSAGIPTYNIGATTAPPVDGGPGSGQPAARIYIGVYGSTTGGPIPKRDGSLDTEILLHEYTHLLTARWVVGLQSFDQAHVQARALSEGWSDFYPLALLSGSSDALAGTYPYAAYAGYRWKGNNVELTQNYYFGGQRRFPYSTDLSKNPLTFNDIDPSDAVSRRPIDVNPTHQQYPPMEPDPGYPEGFIPGYASEEHNAGEVWCATLWDVRANLVNKYGFTVGNPRVLDLVTDGINLCPDYPNFLHARNALLSADLANGGADKKELWAAFYKRGMGSEAVVQTQYAPPRVLEAFNKADFNLDGKPDLIFETAATPASLKGWAMNGASWSADLSFTPSSPGGTWRVVGTSDINRDGKVDLFFQDGSGNLGYWYLNGTAMTQAANLNPSAASPGWRIVATGDFKRQTAYGTYIDNKPDLVMQHSSGWIGVWFMDGVNYVAAASFVPDQYDPKWRIVGTGDFNRDGKTDLLWQYSNPGFGNDAQLAVWYMDGVSMTSPTLLNPAYPSSPKWRVAGTGDYNGDGKVDILFQFKNPGGASDGDLAVWYMDGVNLTLGTLLSPQNPGAGWNVVGPR